MSNTIARTSIAVTTFVNEAMKALPPSNMPTMQQLLFRYAVGKEIESTGKILKEAARKELATVYKSAISRPMQRAELDRCAPFILEAMVTKPRQTFSKNQFINAIAQRYGISAVDLYNLADTCMDTGSSSVTWYVTENTATEN